MNKKTAEKAKEIISPLVKFVWEDMQRNTDLLLEVSKQIEFEKGRRAGYAEGFKDAKSNMRDAMFQVREAVGIYNEKGEK